jgi:hypothetical protein
MLAEISMLLMLSMFGASGHLLGSRLEDAKRTDFLTFFQLEATGAVFATEENYVVGFKPEGDQFGEFVSVLVTFDTDKRIVALDLVLGRPLVDHKTNGVFARDIAKSFLRSAIPEEDEGAIADLVNEIEFPPAGSGKRVVTARPHPKLPSKQTPGYLVYLGKRSLFEQTLTRCRLRLESRKVNKDKVDSLIVYVIAK